MSSEILLAEEESESSEVEVISSQDIALQKFHNASAFLEMHRPSSPSFMRWFDNSKFLGETKIYPLMKVPKNSSYSDTMMRRNIRALRRVKGLAIVPVSAGLLISTMSLVASNIWTYGMGVSLLSLLPFGVGAIISAFFDAKLYDGSTKNPLRSLVCKMFLSKKSKEKVRQY